MKEYLFLYGTLIPGRANNEMAKIVRQLRPIGSGYVRGYLYDLGDYPGAVLDPSSKTRITGEVFELPDKQEILASIDSYEEFDPADLENSLFVRTESFVTLSDNRNQRCWLYVYNKNPGAAPLIVSGDYEKYKAA
ncbi:MAG TPA: gamma-glutamylcyclotransferase family protein [Pyrinomonadaceae bacterium]|nr:gamma-glutamylcyclotransferase family protein [Pyrinomonadaceae bacterium]